MIKLVRYHPKLWIAIGVGVAAYFAFPASWSGVSRLLASWDVGVSSFLVMLYLGMSRLTAEEICSRYIEEDETAPVILIVVTAAALVSLVAIVEPLATLHHVQGGARIGHFALVAATLIDSWLLVPAMFTTRYADMFYSAGVDDRPLTFPETRMPSFWDFAYFSFTIAAACQTADVLTTRASIRKVVIAHELISFVFNASILGFAINVTAGLIGGSG
jgi:uncharacterized membrane protein